MTKTGHYGAEPLKEYIVSMEKKSRNIIYRIYYVKTAKMCIRDRTIRAPNRIALKNFLFIIEKL